MMHIRALFLSVWEFVVGDDWRTALGVVLALALTSLLAETAISAWWLLPLAVFGLLALSVRRAAREATARSEVARSGSD